jgi:hypothetical protein
MTPAMFRIVAALCDHGPMTKHEIARRAFVAAVTFKNACKPVLVANGMIHQSGWRRYQYGFEPVYSAGIGETPPRPDAKRDQGERCREWKQRTGYNEARKASRRLRRPQDRALAALLGMQR